MTKPFRLSVTQKHMADQLPHKSWGCAIANALKERGDNSPSVWYEDITTKGHTFTVSKGLADWQRKNVDGNAKPTTIRFDPENRNVKLLSEWRKQIRV